MDSGGGVKFLCDACGWLESSLGITLRPVWGHRLLSPARIWLLTLVVETTRIEQELPGRGERVFWSLQGCRPPEKHLVLWIRAVQGPDSGIGAKHAHIVSG